ncbi:peptidylprolyl isomerase [Salinimonas lutimaris]|uniref:peptidylprolyl isomerase n=1 Tax=Salinimonas lutimaris TaxID=914153 RepID=UPI0010C037D4|nr:peptidylprolyl isomerase [Salinimonas lutimaris]
MQGLRALIALFLLSISFFTPAEDAADAYFWYDIPQSKLVYVQTAHGQVVIALTDSIAPHHVARFTHLVKQGFYNNRYFYRVLEGFVAQAGSNSTHKLTESTLPLKPEFTAMAVEGFYEVERNSPNAPVSGFINGFPAGATPDRQRYWLAHCPGMVAMARDNSPDTGATEFYIVMGQAPRHLDRNMSIFGRVVAGMDALQKLPRGDTNNNGMIKDFSENSELIYAQMGDDLPVRRQRNFKIQLPGHSAYEKRAEQARTLSSPFFVDDALAPRPVDICYTMTEVVEYE